MRKTIANFLTLALGLPAHFDSTLKPYGSDTERKGRKQLSKVDSGVSEVTNSSISPDSRPSSPSAAKDSPKIQVESSTLSGEESSEGEGDEEDEEEEGDFDVVPGHTLLGDADEDFEIERKKKLHEMEVGEAAALARSRKVSVGSADSVGSATGGVPLDDDADGDADDDMR